MVQGSSTVATSTDVGQDFHCVAYPFGVVMETQSSTVKLSILRHERYGLSRRPLKYSTYCKEWEISPGTLQQMSYTVLNTK